LANHLYVPPLSALFALVLQGAKHSLRRILVPPGPKPGTTWRLVTGIVSKLPSQLRTLLPLIGIGLACAQIWAIDSICDPAPKPNERPSHSVDQIALSTDEGLVFAPDGMSVGVFSALPKEINDKYKRVGSINLPNPRPIKGMARSPDGKYLYVIGDSNTEDPNGVLNVFDLDRHTWLSKSVELGQNPRWIAISPGGDRIYVSNVQSSEDPTHGSITVIDGNNLTIKARIEGVNCPEGMAVSPDARRLYIASQCGEGHDPLFVIDTATYQKIAQIPGLAVGNAVLLTRDGTKAYVTRANFAWRGNGEVGSPLSVVDTVSNRILKTLILQFNTGGLALSPDGRYVLVTNGFQVSVIDTSNDTIVGHISIRGYGTSIAIRSDGMVITAVSDRREIVTFPLQKALESWPCTFP
jgi:DNA-binding beta-propeller fold protein YncE